ncbi:MAG: hypothetical protein BROFUL_01850 [Candidatus Brocadia fulgida]|uniref:Glycosyltransferase n=1 Tax=Candidatus Brocadia fulgida TaxID=380242 RepID=A0A0M2UUY5_9BACT|nr:MAG: hypothetical protein BROFUL_01850 [Candidatus Brocadia fulgida]
MKILLINKSLYPKGGDAISTITTGNLLYSKGHEVMFWGMAHPLNPEYPYKDCFVSCIDFNDPGTVKNQIKMAVNMLYSFEAKKNIEKLMKIERPDIVHLNNFAHQISPSILHVFKKYKIPVVMTMRDYKLICPTYTMVLNDKPCERCRNGRYYQCSINKCTKNSLLKSLLNTMEMYLHHNIMHIYDLIDVYISPSKFLKSKCEEMGFKGKIVYLPNFVRVEDFNPQYDWLESSIVYFGRLSEEKGLFTLIEAVKDIQGITLKIIGEGPLRERLELEVRNSGIRNIEFLGYKGGKELKEEIRKAMFVVYPSEWYENNPRSIIEGFALGKPALGARIGGIPELVKDNETGVTFESGNGEDLKAKIEYLRKNPNKIVEMGKTARVFVEQELNDEKHYEKLMEIYQKTLEGNYAMST